jgi:hypothetical protein
MLARERVLARLHGALSDEDAWGLALADALLREPLTSEELGALRERLAASGIAPWAEELVEDALARAPVAAELRERFLAFLAGAPAPLPDPLPASGERVDSESSTLSLAGGEGREGNIESSTLSPTVGEGREGGPAPDEPAHPPEPQIVEVTPEELVADLAARLSALNQDLATALEAWEDLPAEGRRLLVDQARYVAAALPFMEAK